MARPPSTHPTDGELELLQILWQTGPAGLGHICTALRQQRPIATTTVATMLKVMLDKNLVRRKRTAQGYLWSAKSTRQNTATGMVANWSTWFLTARPSGSWPICWNPTSYPTRNAGNCGGY